MHQVEHFAPCLPPSQQTTSNLHPIFTENSHNVITIYQSTTLSPHTIADSLQQLAICGTLAVTTQTLRVNGFILHPRKIMADVCFSRQDLQD
jgi:hypothetical protein